MMEEDTTTMFQDSKFPMGRIVITTKALGELPPLEVEQALVRHAHGDWGDIDEHDRGENEFAVERRLRLFSVYHTTDNAKFWVITAADRSHTTILLPSDY